MNTHFPRRAAPRGQNKPPWLTNAMDEQGLRTWQDLEDKTKIPRTSLYRLFTSKHTYLNTGRCMVVAQALGMKYEDFVANLKALRRQK